MCNISIKNDTFPNQISYKDNISKLMIEKTVDVHITNEMKLNHSDIFVAELTETFSFPEKIFKPSEKEIKYENNPPLLEPILGIISASEKSKSYSIKGIHSLK
jgi:hypothetical protein